MFAKSLVAATTTALLLAASGCGGSSDDAGPGTTAEGSALATPTDAAPTGESPAADVEVIVIKDFEFSGADSVPPGATVEVRNDDRSTHSVTSDDDAFDEVIVEGNGDTGTFTAPTEPGTYTYVCKFHPEMEGTLVVE